MFDHAPLFFTNTGTILGICVSIGNTTGFIVPYITGILTEKKNTVEQWSYSFYLAGAVGLITGMFFQLFASAEVQSWGLEEKDVSDSKNSELKPIKNSLSRNTFGTASSSDTQPKTLF